MTSIIKLNVLSGAHDEAPLCYLLQVDEFRFLLDCGWNETLDMEIMESIKRHVQQVDAVLVSFPDIYHMGGLPYLVGKCGLHCPIYTTIPVYKMGQMFMYDWYQCHQNSEEFDVFSLDDVDAVFDKIIQLKYSQTVSLKGKGHGITITPYAAGHMIGGTMWKIVKDGEEDIIYAVDYNHKKERHLNGAVLETLSRPSLLITDSFNALNIQTRRRERDTQLMGEILKTMRRHGNVMIAIDTAGRVLELSQLLDQLWRNLDSGLSAYSLAMLNNVSYNVIEFAKSQVEWMSDKIMKAFEIGRNNPYQFRYCHLCHSLADLARVPEPKVVLASMMDLTAGFSRDLFVEWADNPKNTVIFTARSSPGTLARTLIDNLELKQVELEVKQRVRLGGEELERYLEENKKKEKDYPVLAISTLVAEDDSDSEVEDEVASGARHDLMMAEQKSGRKSSFFKQARSFPMFPCHEEKAKWDDYGEFIRPEDYMQRELSATEEEKQKVVRDLSKVPTKCISQKKTVSIRCTLAFIDFEGRSDGESIKRILNLVNPRKLVLVHGDSKSTQHLADYCQSSSSIQVSQVFTPAVGETVEATGERHIYQVKLRDALVSSLQFAQARDAELAWIDGQLDMKLAPANQDLMGDKPGEEKMETDQDEALDTVPVLEQNTSSKIAGHVSVFINEPRLSDFKQVLNKAGIQAEFAGGVLICNNVVCVRRNETGRVGLEGTVCEDYYTIRDLLYSQYAIV
ncbi:predicted protein [Nematostella vectensis]|uniref:Cleavage and polyadenylation specificity factor subunit 2 n=1 Tax=Nematostella vectensis TaxID=45351 RepID=A7RPX1_NEMVE|nr:predicted protein [Nematostella vectensis]|eukprot:XP_001638458.1 predicted protein [Nematostella vectensis]